MSGHSMGKSREIEEASLLSERMLVVLVLMMIRIDLIARFTGSIDDVLPLI